MARVLKRFCRDEAGMSAVEYGLLLAFVTIAILGAMRMIGSSLNSRFASLVTQVN